MGWSDGYDSAKGNMAEIGFMGMDENGQDKLLKGKYIGISEMLERNLKILFDQDLDNYITINITDKKVEGLPDELVVIPYKKEVWVGIDLGKPLLVTHVCFCPRNDTNNIYKKYDYELFYWNNKWISLGKVCPKNNCLTYNNIPANALLLLHNHSGGNEERIFTFQNNNQIWW
jgi:hypothetical protein